MQLVKDLKMKRISIEKNSKFIWLPAFLLLVLFSISENKQFHIDNNNVILVSAFAVPNSVLPTFADLEETEDFNNYPSAEIQLLNDSFFWNSYVVKIISKISFHNKNQLNVTLFNLPPPRSFS